MHLKKEEEEEEEKYSSHTNNDDMLLVCNVNDCLFQSLSGFKETAKLVVACFLIPWLDFL